MKYAVSSFFSHYVGPEYSFPPADCSLCFRYLRAISTRNDVEDDASDRALKVVGAANASSSTSFRVEMARKYLKHREQSAGGKLYSEALHNARERRTQNIS